MEKFINAKIIHGHPMSLDERERIAEEFKNGEFPVLLTTNVLSRGIDWRRVTLVVNFHIPRTYPEKLVDKETYIHRIGRTGRFGDFGVALNLVGSETEQKEVEAMSDEFKMKIVELNPFEKIKESIEKIVDLRYISSVAQYHIDTVNEDGFKERLIL